MIAQAGLVPLPLEGLRAEGLDSGDGVAHYGPGAVPGLAQGINMQEGRITNRAVAESFGMECRPAALE